MDRKSHFYGAPKWASRSLVASKETAWPVESVRGRSFDRSVDPVPELHEEPQLPAGTLSQDS